MGKDNLLRSLAENGYNVSFGAKKHFATYDIVEKVPGLISLAVLIIGVWQIYAPEFKYNKEVSLILIISSIIALNISFYSSEKEQYKQVGSQLIMLHNRLRSLYYNVVTSSLEDFSNEEAEMNNIMNEFYAICIAKQITMSDWYAHYKFFFQTQYEWINEQKHFTWRDKIPFSFLFLIVVLGVISIIIIA